MKQDLLLEIAGRLMCQPAAPYHESLVAAEVVRICEEQGIPLETDEFGNLHATLDQGAWNQPPIVLAAHMDHPGFEIVRPLKKGRWEARFLGGVPDRYFQPGVKLRLQPSGRPAVLGRRLEHKREKRFELREEKPGADKPEFAVWDLRDFSSRGGRIRGRVCDDLIGVAAILATLTELKRKRAKCRVIGFISRAEEVGFQGALAAAGAGNIPRDSLVISLETSKEIPGVKMGQGVIVRVGDRSSVFDSQGSRFLGSLGDRLTKRDAGFTYQRALMAGGSCEGTAFQEYGYRTAAVCVALGNYHNCGDEDCIREEYVSANDAAGMQRLLVEAARRFGDFESIVGRTRVRLERLRREGERRLRRRR